MPKSKGDYQVRLQKYIADCGITSRRKAEEFIKEGKVKVNGILVTEMGVKVSPGEDAVSVDDKVIGDSNVVPTYIIFNKPRGVVSTVIDPEGRKTVLDFLPRIHQRIYPVGRLDYNSEGLLILTNDGQLAHQIMHPSFEVTKVYEVKVFGAVDSKILKELKAERRIEDGIVRPESVRVIGQLPSKTWLEFRLKEGKNREIRKICEAVGIAIDKLRRVSIENLQLGDLKPGDWVFTNKKEIERLLGLNGFPKNTFRSQKRTIDVRVKGVQPCRLANDSYYKKYIGDNLKKMIGRNGTPAQITRSPRPEFQR